LPAAIRTVGEWRRRFVEPPLGRSHHETHRIRDRDGLSHRRGGGLRRGAGEDHDHSAGKVYTDDKGMTLYVFDKDEAGKSNCYDKCAANWPPFKAAAGAMAEDEWTIVKRTDGTAMWAYDGKPVYTYGKDKKAGDVAGDGVGGVWHAAKPD
jgi:predicted lipoprotein with Yx(FWY)xxD motif